MFGNLSTKMVCGFALALTAAGVYLLVRDEEEDAFMKDVLNAVDDCRLAEECIADVPLTSYCLRKNAGLTADVPVHIQMEQVQQVLVGSLAGSVIPAMEDGSPSVEVESPVETVTTGLVVAGKESVVQDCTPGLEVRGSRKIYGGRNRATYTRRVLDACKAKFGTPKPTEANHKAIWRFATTIMKDHGLRPSHQAELLPYVVALTFQPSLEEMIAAKAVGSYKLMVAGKFDEHLCRITRWSTRLMRIFA